MPIYAVAGARGIEWHGRSNLENRKQANEPPNAGGVLFIDGDRCISGRRERDNHPLEPTSPRPTQNRDQRPHPVQANVIRRVARSSRARPGGRDQSRAAEGMMRDVALGGGGVSLVTA